MTGSVPVRDVRLSWIDSRYYYLALCGLLATACVLLALLMRSSGGLRRRLQHAGLVLALVLAIPPLVLVARDRNAWWRESSLESKPLFDAAARVVAELPLRTPCRIFFLGTNNKDFANLVDTALKATASPGSGMDRCLFQTRHTPWYYIIQQAALNATERSPYRQMWLDGRPYPPSHVDNVTIAYWNLLEGTTPQQLPEARFFAWRAGRFVDVTRAVRAGRQPVHFYCNRAPEQCGPQIAQ